MSLEIEIKAWVSNFNIIKRELDKKYHFSHEYTKNDTYLKGIDSSSKKEKEVRLRRVGDENIITFKKRSHQGKVEVNIEKEFTVDNSNNFLFTMEQLGYTPYVTKIKNGFCYKLNNINIELSHVESLGDFIEIEYITELESEIEEAKLKIHSILDQLEIPRENIEDRFYVEMLLEKRANN